MASGRVTLDGCARKHLRSAHESDALYARWTIPAPGRPLLQAATANVTPHSQDAVATDSGDRGPLLLIAGGKDHTVPEKVTKATLKQYRHSSAVTERRWTSS